MLGEYLERYKIKLKSKYMTEYMKRDNTLPENSPSPFDNTPFAQVAEVEQSSDEWVEIILNQAEKIRQTAKRRGQISDDTDVIESLALPNEYVPAESFYAQKVGPVTATCDTLEWKSAYTMDLDAAPHPKSDAFHEAASKLQIPDTPYLEYAPKFVQSSYRILYEHTKTTGRPIHPIQLKIEADVVLDERYYSKAFSYLNDLPGVEPPSETTAWEYVAQEQTTGTETEERGEMNA
jgi:hypothetical protein